MDTLHIHIHTGTSTWQQTLRKVHTVKGYLCTHISRHMPVCGYGFILAGWILAVVSDSFGALVQGSGGERERDITLFTARLCITYAYLTLTFLSATYALTHTYILKKAVFVPLYSCLSLSHPTVPLNPLPLPRSPHFLHSGKHTHALMQWGSTMNVSRAQSSGWTDGTDE